MPCKLYETLNFYFCILGCISIFESLILEPDLALFRAFSLFFSQVNLRLKKASSDIISFLVAPSTSWWGSRIFILVLAVSLHTYGISFLLLVLLSTLRDGGFLKFYWLLCFFKVVSLSPNVENIWGGIANLLYLDSLL